MSVTAMSSESTSPTMTSPHIETQASSAKTQIPSPVQKEHTTFLHLPEEIQILILKDAIHITEHNRRSSNGYYFNNIDIA